MTLENILAHETSPYLLQHAGNPVAWRPWGDDTLALARALDRPILLSVGYAACHWCHVMAHECFEDPAIAAQMNTLFVNIKVDREERPDIDQIYQLALSALGQHGGWPLTMFLTPAGEPFWGGTYFPPSPRYGRPGFPQILDSMSRAYHQDPEAVAKNRDALMAVLAAEQQPVDSSPVDDATLDAVAQRLAAHVDPANGGLGGAPKFPQPVLFDFLWRRGFQSGAGDLTRAVEHTLTRMAQGGIYDHLRGGFARYAVDAEWLAPHFEKMLYDNALLLGLYGRVHAATGDPLYAARIRETVAWVLDEMRLPEGGFAASLDADSEGHEGRFYVWSKAEIDRLLGADAPFFSVIYDVTEQGNWEGHTILNRLRHPALLSAPEEARLAPLRAVLLGARAHRVRPGFDDKVLADWNGLMITALAELAPAFGESTWLGAAVTAFDFALRALRPDGRLHQSWRAGRAQHRATIDAIANLARAALALYEVTGTARYLDAARSLVAEAEAHYADHDGGGFFFTAADAPALIVRSRNAHDNAVPAGNGTMVEVYARLALLTGDGHYQERAEAQIDAFSGAATRNFAAFTSFLIGIDLLRRPVEVVIAGAADDPRTQALITAAWSAACPNRVVLAVAPGDLMPPGHPAAGRTGGDRPLAFICVARRCGLPLDSPAALHAGLRAAAIGHG